MYLIYTGDIDGDGDQDLVVTAGSSIFWFRNNGSGFFTTAQNISATLHISNWAHSADIDGDGDLDIVSSAANDDNVVWFENTDGAGTFGTQQLISDDAYGANSVFAGDLDGDGYTDVVSTSAGDNKIAWYKNVDGA